MKEILSSVLKPGKKMHLNSWSTRTYRLWKASFIPYWLPWIARVWSKNVPTIFSFPSRNMPIHSVEKMRNHLKTGSVQSVVSRRSTITERSWILPNLLLKLWKYPAIILLKPKSSSWKTTKNSSLSFDNYRHSIKKSWSWNFFSIFPRRRSPATGFDEIRRQ